VEVGLTLEFSFRQITGGLASLGLPKEISEINRHRNFIHNFFNILCSSTIRISRPDSDFCPAISATSPHGTQIAEFPSRLAWSNTFFESRQAVESDLSMQSTGRSCA
jgi:hypothetical protein